MPQTIHNVRINLHNASKQADTLKAVQMIADALDETLAILEDTLKHLPDDLADKVADQVSRSLERKLAR